MWNKLHATTQPPPTQNHPHPHPTPGHSTPHARAHSPLHPTRRPAPTMHCSLCGIGNESPLEAAGRQAQLEAVLIRVKDRVRVRVRVRVGFEHGGAHLGHRGDIGEI